LDDDLLPGYTDPVYPEEAEDYFKAYCEYCDYGMGVPEDDCFCEENCGAIGCQGVKISVSE
jgi:hypothetical protein